MCAHVHKHMHVCVCMFLFRNKDKRAASSRVAEFCNDGHLMSAIPALGLPWRLRSMRQAEESVWLVSTAVANLCRMSYS